MKTIKYPGFSKLSIIVPEDWEPHNQERIGVFSADKKLEVAGTAFGTNGKSIEEFTKDKNEAILIQMKWYKVSSELKKINHPKYTGYVQEYQGIWPNEETPTTYIVTTIGMDGVAMSLTFTCLTKEIDAYRSIINNIIMSIDLKK
jgi:hypothetical protein